VEMLLTSKISCHGLWEFEDSHSIDVGALREHNNWLRPISFSKIHEAHSFLILRERHAHGRGESFEEAKDSVLVLSLSLNNLCENRRELLNQEHSIDDADRVAHDEVSILNLSEIKLSLGRVRMIASVFWM